MAIINTSSAEKNVLQAHIAGLREALESRRLIWEKLTQEQRNKFKADPSILKDPLIRLVFSHYRELQDFFGDK